MTSVSLSRRRSSDRGQPDLLSAPESQRHGGFVRFGAACSARPRAQPHPRRRVPRHIRCGLLAVVVGALVEVFEGCGAARLCLSGINAKRGGGGSGWVPQRGRLFKLDFPSANFWVKIFLGWVRPRTAPLSPVARAQPPSASSPVHSPPQPRRPRTAPLSLVARAHSPSAPPPAHDPPQPRRPRTASLSPVARAQPPSAPSPAHSPPSAPSPAHSPPSAPSPAHSPGLRAKIRPPPLLSTKPGCSSGHVAGGNAMRAFRTFRLGPGGCLGFGGRWGLPEVWWANRSGWHPQSGGTGGGGGGRGGTPVLFRRGRPPPRPPPPPPRPNGPSWDKTKFTTGKSGRAIL